MFPEAQIRLWQYKYVLDLWRIADDWELLDRRNPDMDLITIIQKLSKLPSMKTEDAKNTFKNLQEEYTEKCTWPKELIAEFFKIFEGRYMNDETLSLMSTLIILVIIFYFLLYIDIYW